MPELNIVEKVIALEAVDLLKNLTPDQLARIASIAREEKLLPGKALLEPNKNLDALYVILDGSVEISRNEQALHTAGQNEVLGSWALFDSEPLAVTARAVSDTRLLRIGRDDFFDLLSDNMEIAASIFQTIVHRFREIVEK
jgi:CRP-like cAMP-binding protein